MIVDGLLTFYGKESGPTVSIFSWTHGNETSWIFATQKLIRNLKEKRICLKNWTLHIVSHVNKIAVEQWVRWLTDISTGQLLDINRFFQDTPTKMEWYEYLRSRALMPLIDSSNYLLDLHSTSWPSYPYAFAENQSKEFAKLLGIGYIVSWWGSAEEWNETKKNNPSLNGDIESYATNHGVLALTFEAWDHNSPNWEENAYQVCLNLLVKTWLINEEYFLPLSKKRILIQMTHVYTGINDIFTYAFPIQANFTPLKKWELIWHDGDIAVICPYDCVLVMPTLDPNTKIRASNQKDKNVFQIGLMD